MEYSNLGRSNIKVSRICLGSMTWGTQNTEDEGHRQIDYAVSEGVNFIDTAEIYPTTPMSAETLGRTEEIIGSWFKNSGKRDEIILGTKVAGTGLKWVQGGAPITAKKIKTSLEGSLKRLQTDYVDLYQLHWPNRGSYHFRQNWEFDATEQNTLEMQDSVLDILSTLQALIQEGKVRTIGLSNESSWGTMQFLNAATEHNLPRMATVQNEYSFMYRAFDLDMAELSHHENVGLLAYSPLSAGMLTGKYNNGEVPEGSRRSMNSNLFQRYSEQSIPAMHAYTEIANKHNLDPSQLALAFCLSRPFMASVIIGATSEEQLRTNIASKDIKLSDEVLSDIAQTFRKHPVPM